MAVKAKHHSRRIRIIEMFKAVTSLTLYSHMKPWYVLVCFDDWYKTEPLFELFVLVCHINVSFTTL